MGLVAISVKRVFLDGHLTTLQNNSNLAPLTGAVWVEQNWRMTFRIENGHTILVDYRDYH